MVISIGCDETAIVPKKEVLNYDMLVAHLGKDFYYSQYIQSKAENIIILSTLSDEQTSQKDNLEQALLLNRNRSESDALLEFYESINLNIKEPEYYVLVKENLSNFMYDENDLKIIIQNSTNDYLRKQISQGVITLELSCSMHCEQMTADEFQGSFDGLEKGSVAWNCTMGEKNGFFRGCYKHCVN